MDKNVEQLDVAIIGGGIAGLCVAHELMKLDPGLNWRLFEASDRFGGKVLTESIDHDDGRFLIEAGPDAFLTQKPWAKILANELGLEDRLIPISSRPNPVAVVKHGIPVDLPAGASQIAPTAFMPFARTSLLSFRAKARVALDLALPRGDGAGDQSLGDFVRRRFGQEALDWIAEPLVAGIYNADPDDLSLKATFPQFIEIERRHRSVIRGLCAARRERPSSPSMPAFMSLRDGMQELVDALVVRAGSRAATGCPVISLARQHDGRLLIETPHGRYSAGAVILAVPAANAATLLASIAPAAAERLAELRTIAAGNISLAYRSSDVRKPLRGYGLVIPRVERLPINAVTIASDKFTGRAPAGWTLIRVFFGGTRSPGTMHLDDAELLDVVRGQFRNLMGIEAPPAFHRTHRWPAGSPQCDVGHLDRIAQIERLLPGGIFVTGGAYRGIGIPDIARNAVTTAGSAYQHMEGRIESAPRPLIQAGTRN